MVFSEYEKKGARAFLLGWYFFMIRTLIFLSLLCILVSQQTYAQSSRATRSGASQSYKDDMFLNNRGYLYYNPNVPEKTLPRKQTLYMLRDEARRSRSRRKPRRLKEPVMEQPVYREPIMRDRREEPYYSSIEEELMEERKRALVRDSEIETLRTKLERALRQLSAATQKIMQFYKETPLSTKITQTYQVKEGDSLWTIAAKKEIYDNPKKWLLLYHANRDQLYDPNLIFTDMVLLVPRIDEYESR